MTITPETRRNLYARAIEKDDAELARLRSLLERAQADRNGIQMVSIAVQIEQVERQRAGRVERMKGGAS